MCVYQHQDHLFALLMVVPGKRPHSSRILEAASQHIVYYIAEVAGEAAAASCLLHYTTTTVVQSTTTTTTSGGGITAAIHYALIFSSAIVVQFHNSVRHRLLLGSRGQQSSCIVLETVCTIVDGADTHHHTHTHTAITFQFSTTLTCAHRNVDRRGASSSSSLYRGCYVEADAKNEETTRPSLLHTIHSLRLLLTHCFFFLVYLCLFEVPPFHSRTSVYSVTTTTTS